VKDPKKIFPSYNIELVWETHFEFTQSYREFSNFFYNRFVKLPTQDEFGTSKSRKKYSYTKAHYERVFSYPPDPLIWEDEEDRFNRDYTKRMYVNIRRLCLTMSIKQVNLSYLKIPHSYKTGLKSDKPSLIQIKTNREDRIVISDKGKLYKWRRFYPNSDELYSDNKAMADSTTENSFDEYSSVSAPKMVSVDFFKEGGLIFVKDPSDIS
jgi:hypothetical protein